MKKDGETAERLHCCGFVLHRSCRITTFNSNPRCPQCRNPFGTQRVGQEEEAEEEGPEQPDDEGRDPDYQPPREERPPDEVQLEEVRQIVIESMVGGWDLEECVLEMGEMIRLVRSNEEISGESLKEKLILSVQGADERRNVSMLNAYNTGVFLRKYVGDRVISLRDLAEELEIEGLSKSTISVYMNFSKVMDDVSSENRNKLCFLYKCPKSWRNIKKYLKKTRGSRSRPVVGNCPLWTALNEVDL